MACCNPESICGGIRNNLLTVGNGISLSLFHKSILNSMNCVLPTLWGTVCSRTLAFAHLRNYSHTKFSTHSWTTLLYETDEMFLGLSWCGVHAFVSLLSKLFWLVQSNSRVSAAKPFQGSAAKAHPGHRHKCFLRCAKFRHQHSFVNSFSGVSFCFLILVQEVLKSLLGCRILAMKTKKPLDRFLNAL